MTKLRPAILLVHSQTWVSKKIRELPGLSYVIGGHPGITPRYRGSHSSFWALYNQDSENLGWTVFHLDGGVDTGDVIAQGRISPGKSDSFNVINWQAMRCIGVKQAEVIVAFDRGDPIPRKKHDSIPEGSEYSLPTFGPYCKILLRRQK